MSSHGSVTHWIAELKAGDEAAAQKLWERYFSRLVALCRKTLANHPRQAADEEDAALSAFGSLCQGAQQGKFPLLRDRDNLWPLLVTIATRKAFKQIQHEIRQKRGGGQVLEESAIAGDHPSTGRWGANQVIGNEPTPELAAIVTEEYERLMECLEDETLRTVARLKLENYTSKEIAPKLGCSVRTVARKLWLIRITWSQEIPGDE